jgi:hypothetical protein
MADLKKFNKTYEENDIKLRGILGFGFFLLALILVTFALMWILQYQILKPQFDENNKAGPMALKPEEKLPPEPRIQAAPGFGVDGPDGRINLELKHPQAEMEEMRKIWGDIEKNGQKKKGADGKDTGEYVVLPMDEAKKRVLSEVGKSIKVRQSAPPKESPEMKKDEKAGSHGDEGHGDSKEN